MPNIGVFIGQGIGMVINWYRRRKRFFSVAAPERRPRPPSLSVDDEGNVHWTTQETPD